MFLTSLFTAKRAIWAAVWLSILFSGMARAQEIPFDAFGNGGEYVPKSEKQVTWTSVLSEIPGDYADFFKSFTSKKQLLTLTKVAILTGALTKFDQPTWNFSHNFANRDNINRNLCHDLVEIGDGKYHALAAAAFIGTGLATGNERTLRVGHDILESLIASGLLVQTFKRISGRESPAADDHDSRQWHIFPNLGEYQKHQTKFYAFPSGHITTTVSTLTVIVNSYPEYKWLKPASYAVVAGVGFGLMSRDMHWISDYPLAVLVGYTIGTIVTGDNKLEISERKSIKMMPFVNAKTFGTQIYYEF